MTTRPDPDLTIAAWLDDGPIDLPDETRRAITVAVRTQRRARQVAFLRGWPMLPLNRLATAAAIVLVVGGLSVFALSNRAGGPGATPAPSASLAPTPTPAATPTGSPRPTASPVSVAGWLPFHSTRYGYDAKYPPSMTAAQSTRQWTLADRSDWLSPANDTFEGSVGITARAITLPAGTTRDAWISSALGSPDPCGNTPLELGTKQVGGYPVVFYSDDPSKCGGTSAFVLVGDRLYYFFIGLPNYEPTLEAFLSTVRFQAPAPGSPRPS
jgi:hypothetical protein